MKFISFFGYLFLLLIYGEQNCSGQSWLWGQQGYSLYDASTYYSPVATDKEGNAYLTGAFEDTMVFSTTQLYGSVGPGYFYSNVFLVKFDSTGKLIWAREPSTNSNTSIASESVTTDKNGNVFITGYVGGNAVFGNYSVGGPNGSCTFLVKYDNNGNVLWAEQSSLQVQASSHFVNACSVATDDSGNAFITGTYEGGVSFGPDTLTALPDSINVFIVKYDASGNVRWAKQSTHMRMETYQPHPGSITTDIYGDAYITRYFIDSIAFGKYTLYSPLGNPSAFLVKYSPQGTLLWARQSVNSKFNDTSQAFGYSVISDLGGNVYLTGGFEDSVAFGSHKLWSPAGYSVFLTKYDSGGKVLWAEQSSLGWGGTGLAADDSNHIYLSGMAYYNHPPFLSTLNFGSVKLDADKNDGSEVSFIIKFDTDGKADCGSILNHALCGFGTGAASDITGTYIYTGTSFFGDTVICGPDTMIYKGSNAIGGDVLVARWKPCKNSSGISPPPPPPPVPSPPSPSPVEPSSCNIFVPDVFSPNESINNILYVRGDCISSIKFLVFDRWGNKIFESKNQSDGWDGDYGGSPMNTGTYIWYLKATTYGGANVEKKGNVTLVR